MVLMNLRLTDMKKEIKKAGTIPNHTYEKTSDPDVFRVCDRNGDWRFYFKKSTGQYAPAVNYIISQGFNKGPRFQNWLLQQRPEEAQRILESAGDRGTRVHAAIRDLIGGNEVKIDQQYPSELTKGRFEPLTAEEWNCIRGFANWFEEYQPEVMGQEIVVFGNTELYAGTIDFLGTILTNKGRIQVLIDWKSSSGIWDEYKLQVAAYWNAYIWGKIDEFVPDYTAIVRIGTKHKAKFEMQLFDAKETMDNYKRFLEVKSLHHFVNPDNDKPNIEDLPSVFKFDVPVWKPAKKEKKPRSRTAKKSKCCGARLIGDQCENCGMDNKKENVGKTN